MEWMQIVFSEAFPVGLLDVLVSWWTSEEVAIAIEHHPIETPEILEPPLKTIN